MTFDAMGPGALDYLPCRYGKSRLLFRGPRRNLDAPYVAFVGGTETYGKFIGTPFPALVEAELGTTCVNLGLPNAGIDAFVHDPFVPIAMAKSDVTVLQVMGAQNMTNRFYTVHPRRNDRFVSASTLLRTIFREVDFADFHFNRHMLSALAQASADRFDAVRDELQTAWSARMRLMLKQATGKTVVLWLANAPPSPAAEMEQDVTGTDPLFVTQEMMAEVAELATTVLEVIPSKDARDKGTDGMVFSEMESVAAAEMMGPAAHEEAAQAIAQAIENLR